MSSIVAILELVIFLLTIAILLRVLFSWINVSPYQNEFAGLVYRLTDPIIEPVRRVVPSVSGLDLSPMIVLILLNVLRQLVGSLLR